jgi:hypothetical protein
VNWPQRRIMLKMLRAECSVMEGWRGDTWDRRSRLFRRARRDYKKRFALHRHYANQDVTEETLREWRDALLMLERRQSRGSFCYAVQREEDRIAQDAEWAAFLKAEDEACWLPPLHDERSLDREMDRRRGRAGEMAQAAKDLREGRK